MKISDSNVSYSMEPTTVDISNKKSVENFLQTLEETLANSEINVTMDLDGNITFKRLDGGKIILQEFSQLLDGKVPGIQLLVKGRFYL